MSAKVRTIPRISINKLGEYMVATATRRRAIVKAQKHPSDFVVARYQDAMAAIKEAMAFPATAIESINERLNSLNSSHGSTTWHEQDRQLSIQALDAFLKLLPSLALSEYKVDLADPSPIPLVIEGLEISVRPDLLLTGQRRDGETTVGAVKLYFSKTIPFNIESGLYASTTLHQYLTDCLRPGPIPQPEDCYVLDVFGGKAYPGPKAVKRRREDILAACQEILRAWPAL